MPSNIYKSEPAIGKSEKGQANGVSTLDASGHVPGSQLDIVNALDSTSTDKPLSAAQGKVLNDQIATHDIASNTDLNSLTEPGDYGCALNNTAATLSHCPVSKAFTMRVMRYGASSLSVEQIIYCSITSFGIYWRRGSYSDSSYTWTDWVNVALSDTVNKITEFSATGITTQKTFSGSSYATYSLTLTKSSWVNCRCYLGKIFIDGGDIRIGAIADIAQASGGFLNILPAGTYTVVYIGSDSNSGGSVLVQDAV